MLPGNETRRIQSVLKPLLKSNGYSYPALAEELRVSVPTVKRMLTKDDMSVERLAQICRLLDMQIQDLLELSRAPDTSLHMLNAAEEAFFAKNPSYLYYLLALVGERRTPKDLEKIFGISRRSTQLYLRQLSAMGLIKVLPDERVKLLVRGLIGWDDHGVLGKVVSHGWIRGIVERNLNRTAEESYHELSGRMLTPTEYEELKGELRAIVVKYRQISKVNASARNVTKTRRYDILIMAERRPERSPICEL